MPYRVALSPRHFSLCNKHHHPVVTHRKSISQLDRIIPMCNCKTESIKQRRGIYRGFLPTLCGRQDDKYDWP